MQGFVGRSIKRDKTRIKAKIEWMGHESRGSVLDLSEKGARLYISEDLPVRVGNNIRALTDEMGLLSGVVCWVKLPCVGVKLELSSNSRAQVESYYKYFRT